MLVIGKYIVILYVWGLRWEYICITIVGVKVLNVIGVSIPGKIACYSLVIFCGLQYHDNFQIGFSVVYLGTWASRSGNSPAPCVVVYLSDKGRSIAEERVTLIFIFTKECSGALARLAT